MPEFPKPVYIGKGSARWKLSDLVARERRRACLPPIEIAPDQERFLKDYEVGNRYSVSRMTIWRWARGG